MFKWLKNFTTAKPEAEKPEPKVINGFFSTDFNPSGKTLHSILTEANARVFQRKPEHFKPTGTMDKKEATLMKSTMDAAGFNAEFAIGASIPPAQIGWYASQSFIGYQTCAMLAQHWLIDKACSMPARDAIRNGWDVTVNSGDEIEEEVFNYIYQRDTELGINNALLEYVRMGRIYGIRIAMFDIMSTDPEYYEKPFNIDGVTAGSYRGIIQIDPYWIVPELDMDASINPMSRHFYEPTYWRVAGGKRIHRSHLIIMTLGDVPDILKPTYLYGSPSIPQKIYERVYGAERIANEAPLLALSKRTNALHVDMNQVTAQPEKFRTKMEEWVYYRDNYGIKVLGLEETLEQFDTSLTDLDDVIMTQFQLVAAIASVPATKLLGTSPKGFGASGEYEESSYREELESIQMHNLTPLLDRHYLLLIKSEVLNKFSLPALDLSVVWTPLDSPTAKEQADTNNVKANTAKTLFDMGAITGEDERARLIMDEDSEYNGLESDEGLDLDAPATADVPESVNENIKNLSGRQHQNMERIIRKHEKGSMTEEQASTLLKTGLGLGETDIQALLGTTPEEIPDGEEEEGNPSGNTPPSGEQPAGGELPAGGETAPPEEESVTKTGADSAIKARKLRKKKRR